MRYFEIGPNEAGQRIDNFLLKVLKNVPRSHVYRLLRSGQVRVNKGRKKPTYKLSLGDSVRLPPIRQDETAQIRPPDALCERLLKRILFEDHGYLVMDKPAGIAVHGGTGMKFGLIEVMRHARSDLDYLELGHRLDRGTSGCLVLAKNREALGLFHDGLREGRHAKHYNALLVGEWAGGDRSINTALQTQRSAGGERIVAPDEEGKEALSHFTPLDVWPEASYMDIRIETGRMHQIRVHAAEQGHAVAGDDKYSDKASLKAMKEFGLRRMFLHARKLEVDLQGNTLSAESPLPPELETVLDKFREKNA